jgi:hypothetical protein
MVCPSKKNLPQSPVQGRPVKGSGSSFDAGILTRIGHYRGLHAKWGAKTILVELIEQDKYCASVLPSCSTIERYLRSQSLSTVYEKHRPLDSHSRNPVENCHDCWEMDDKGAETYPGIGEVSMINIKDVKSGVHTQSFGVGFPHKRCHPNISDYQCALRLAFCEFGLPKCIQADHGSNFYENRSKSPFPTPLHLWLLGLGIDLVWARIYRPTDQARVERTHQTLNDQIQQSFDFNSWDNFKSTVEQRRKRLNNHIPCDTTGKPPLVAFPQAKHSGRYFNPITEKDAFDTKLVSQYLHLKEWFRKVSEAKTISLGGQVYYIAKAKPKTDVKIIFDNASKNLIFYDVKELIAQLPIKGIGFQDLVEPNFFNTLISLQFEFPFDWGSFKINTTF